MAQLDRAACERVEAAIAELERSTSCELVVAEAAASDDYTDLALGYGITLALAAAAVAHLIAPELAVAWLIALQSAVVLVCVAAFRAGPVVRLLVPKQRLSQSVERRAREAFFEHGLVETRDHTGVLILISALEHRVAILGDRGIDQYLHGAGWEVHVHHIARAIRQGHPAEGICEVIRAIGAVLAEHLPPRADDIDELANEVRRH